MFSALFILLQSFLLVDFAWSWAQHWVDRWEETGNVLYKRLLIGFCTSFYALAFIGSALMLAYFGPPMKMGCAMNTTFVAVNIVLSVMHTVVAVAPMVQERTPRSGLFQSAVLSAYSTYLVASSIASQDPESEVRCGLETAKGNDRFAGTMVYVGVLVTFLALGYSAFSAGSTSAVMFQPLLRDTDEEQATYRAANDDKVNADDDDADDESESVTYSYAFYHFVYVMAAFYMAMVLTDWRAVFADPSSPNGFAIVHGDASRWVKVATSWLCVVLYAWTLVAPILLPDRNFGYG